MPSHLRLASTIEPSTASPTFSSPPTQPTKTAKMTLTQTYYIASTARSKLGREAARADHNLRRLVGHANMLDQLMLELSQAEQDQEAWFNNSVRTAQQARPEEPRRVQWIDTIAEEHDDESDDDDDDEVYDESDAESDLDETEMFNIPLRRLKSPPVQLGDDDTDDEEDEEMEDEEERRDAIMPSSSPSSPPELTYEDDSDSESDDMPSSPRNAPLELSEKDRQTIVSTTEAFFADVDDKIKEDFDMTAPRQPAIAAC